MGAIMADLQYLDGRSGCENIVFIYLSSSIPSLVFFSGKFLLVQFNHQAWIRVLHMNLRDVLTP